MNEWGYYKKRHAINHFYEKLLKLKDIVHTKEAKKIADARTIYMQEFLNEFYDEWNGKNKKVNRKNSKICLIFPIFCDIK